ncbi:RidA family protein [Paludisphaera rhizosphaerae]|uniref:RidA family protein n=1 Tax=Paludisphaera rhizosphaerae TaxID=2711216 RepID=UPI0013EB3667|nr:RidA family protein [Paludisphaera rhizosphaerae]
MALTTRLTALFLLTAAAAASPIAHAGDEIRRLRLEPDQAGAAAVIVPLQTNLIHTTQVFPVDELDRVVAEAQQIETTLDRLDRLILASGSHLADVVRLHVVLGREDWREPLRAALAKRLGGAEAPAWTFVGGTPARPGAILAIDAVVSVAESPAPGRRVTKGVLTGFTKGSAAFSILSGGPRVFISGQAEQDADLATATRQTLRSLGDSLRTLGLGREHVAQFKAFVQPADSTDVVERELAAFYEGDTPPPLVLVGWKSPATTPIEIELIAASDAPAGADAVEYPPLPPLKPSPVFSRSARVNRGSLVYTSGLLGPKGADGAGQVQGIFDDLRGLLTEAGSDFRNMAKATYYVSDPTADAALGAIRPKLYDPARPPAASKAIVPGVASPGRGIEIDMIAVTP